MKSISGSQPVEILIEGKPDDGETEPVSVKKRGAFLPSRFFGHKDKEATSRMDEKPGVPGIVDDLLESTTDAAEAVAVPDSPVNKLALREPPVAEGTTSVVFPNEPTPTMIPTDPAHRPDLNLATAQLTFGFEIASLQLTPLFKVGAIQLRAFSDVVSLHLVAVGQQENPLAAAVAFQIEQVELDGATGFRSLLLKPLSESREVTAPRPRLRIGHVGMSGGDDAPISVTTSEQASTTVQLFGTFTIAAIDFTPAFAIESLRLEPTSKIVFVRVAPSSLPIAQDLPPAFEIAEIQTGDNAQIVGARLIPSAPENVKTSKQE